MTTAGKLTTDVIAAGTPAGAALYPLPPTIYQECVSFAVEYISDPESVSTLIPSVLEVDDPCVVAVNFIRIPMSSLGTYYEVQVTVNVRLDGEPRRYHAFMFVSSEADVPLAIGRELLGAPKKAARIGFEHAGEAFVGTLDRPVGFPLLRTMVAPKVRVDLSGAPTVAAAPSLMLRVVPYLDGQDDREQIHLVEAMSSYEIHERWTGIGGIAIPAVSDLDPLHRFPVRAIRAATYSRLSIDSPRVRVVRELR